MLEFPDNTVKAKKLAAGWLQVFGDPSQIRTADTLIKSQVLCQLS